MGHGNSKETQPLLLQRGKNKSLQATGYDDYGTTVAVTSENRGSSSPGSSSSSSSGSSSPSSSASNSPKPQQSVTRKVKNFFSNLLSRNGVFAEPKSPVKLENEHNDKSDLSIFSINLKRRIKKMLQKELINLYLKVKKTLCDTTAKEFREFKQETFEFNYFDKPYRTLPELYHCHDEKWVEANESRKETARAHLKKMVERNIGPDAFIEGPFILTMRDYALITVIGELIGNPGKLKEPELQSLESFSDSLFRKGADTYQLKKQQEQSDPNIQVVVVPPPG